MNRRGVVALLGAIVILLALNLMALEPRDDSKPMVAIPKRCAGITSQTVPGPGGYSICLFRAFEDGSTEFLRIDSASLPKSERPSQWRPLPEPAVGKVQVP